MLAGEERIRRHPSQSEVYSRGENGPYRVDIKYMFNLPWPPARHRQGQSHGRDLYDQYAASYFRYIGGVTSSGQVREASKSVAVARRTRVPWPRRHQPYGFWPRRQVSVSFGVGDTSAMRDRNKPSQVGRVNGFPVRYVEDWDAGSPAPHCPPGNISTILRTWKATVRWRERLRAEAEHRRPSRRR